MKNVPKGPTETPHRRVAFQRVASAPSVPARNQSYGYEEVRAPDAFGVSMPLPSAPSPFNPDLTLD